MFGCGSRLSSILILATTMVMPATLFAQTANPTRIDKDRVIYERIEDVAPVRSEAANPDEYAAYNAVLTFARQFPGAELEAAARRDVSFKDLYKPGRKEFKLELLYLEGRLQRFRSIGPTRQLREAGIDELYEAWFSVRGQRIPVCVLTTERPDALSATPDLRTERFGQRMAVAGYFFKLMQYETSDPNPEDPARGKTGYAPLLMGRSITLLPDTGRDPADDWYGTFLPAVAGGLGAVAAAVLGLSMWYRRGDRAARAALAARQDVNPFA